jgi:hypothetical protein
MVIAAYISSRNFMSSRTHIGLVAVVLLATYLDPDMVIDFTTGRLE